MSVLAKHPVLIVDKEGILGPSLAEHLAQTSLTVLVSSQHVEGSNIIPIPFHKKIPRIPNNSFSHLFVVYSGEKELEEAFLSFIAKAKETQAKLILITSVFHYKEEIADKLFQLYEHAQVIVIGDIFSQVFHMGSSPVNQLLFEAKTFGRVELGGNGLSLLYPIALTDAVQGIISSAFTLAEDGQIFALLPTHPVPQLSFARMLQKLYPLLQIDFIKGKYFLPRTTLPKRAIPVLTETLLESRLKQLDLTHTPLAAPLSKKTSRKFKVHTPASSKRPLFLIISLIFFLLALPFLLTMGSAITGGILLKQTETQAEKGDLSQALASAKAASTFFTLSDQTAITLRSIVSVVGLSHEVLGFQTLIHSGKEVAYATTELLEAGNQLQLILGSSKPASKEEYLAAIDKLKQGATSLQAIEAEDTLPEAYKKRLAMFERPMSLMINLLDASPQLLGFNGKQRYLVLFQNNFELRPGGGFIGSYGIVDVDHGKISQLKVNDVYDADGKLSAHIDPPFGLRRYMGAPNWFLRDSNYSPDFSTSASQAASFLKLETGESVNGVIGIDVSFLSSLLEATGPVKLPDYQQTLTKDNFYLLTQSQVENNFFPGSTQKKDFLRAAEAELMKRLQARQFSYKNMLMILTSNIVEKHLLFAFPDQTMQKLFSVNNLSASLRDQREQKPNTYLDGVGISEANIGQNKSNYYLKRSIDQTVTIDGEGIVTHSTKLTYTNTSSKQSQFSGDYKAYLRLIAPRGAVLTGIQIDNTEQVIAEAVTDENRYLAKSFKPPQGIEVDTSEEGGKTLFGLVLVVPQTQTKTLTITYRLPTNAPVDSQEWTYAFQFLKQQGTLSDPYSLTVNYPLAVKVFTSEPGVNDLGGKAVIDGSLNRDQVIDLTFIQR